MFANFLFLRAANARLADALTCAKICGVPDFGSASRCNAKSSYNGLSMPEGVPDQSWETCMATPMELLSIEHPNARQTKVQFHNTASEPAQIYWHPAHGQPELVGIVPPNEYHCITTREGHAFRIWSFDNSEVLGDFRAGRVPLSRNGFPAENSTVLTHHDLNPEAEGEWDNLDVDWDQARRVGFVNRAGVKLGLYWFNVHDGQENLVDTILPGQTGYQLSYHTHIFRARTDEGVLVQEHQLGDFIIPDCSLRRRCDCGSKLRMKIRKPLTRSEARNETASERGNLDSGVVHGVTIAGLSA